VKQSSQGLVTLVYGTVLTVCLNYTINLLYETYQSAMVLTCPVLDNDYPKLYDVTVNSLQDAFDYPQRCFAVLIEDDRLLS
jgi:hypothetical protein